MRISDKLAKFSVVSIIELHTLFSFANSDCSNNIFVYFNRILADILSAWYWI